MDGQLATIELSLEAAVRNILLLIEDLVGQVLAALTDPHSLVHNAVGPIILSMSFVYAVYAIRYTRATKHQRAARKKEETMQKKSLNETKELAQKALRDAERVQQAMEDLPEIEDIRRFKSFLSTTSLELRKQLNMVVGPETQQDVVRLVAQLYEAMAKSEEIRIRASLAKEQGAFNAKLAGVNTNYSILGMAEVKKAYVENAPLLGYDPNKSERMRLILEKAPELIAEIEVLKLVAAAAGTQPQLGNSLEDFKLLLEEQKRLELLPKSVEEEDRVIGPGRDYSADVVASTPDRNSVIEGQYRRVDAKPNGRKPSACAPDVSEIAKSTSRKNGHER